MGKLVYSMADIYPNAVNWDTSDITQPDSEDKEVLDENGDIAEEVQQGKASYKKILMAFLLIVLLVVFFGVGGGKA